MIEKRKSLRVPLTSKTILSQNGTTYRGHLENISMNGALIRLEQDTRLPIGNGYSLAIYSDDEDAPIQLCAEVVCFTFAMAGVKFVSSEADTESRLKALLAKYSAEAGGAILEQERIRRRLTDYLREE